MFLSMRQERLSCPLIGWLLRCKVFELKNISITWGATQTTGSVFMLHGHQAPWEAHRCQIVQQGPELWDQRLFADVRLTAARHIQVRKINLIPGSAPRAMSGFLILLLSCSHLPCWGQGFCPFLLSPYLSSGRRRKKAAESNAKSSQELAFCSSLSGQVSCSLPHFQFHRGKGKALVICKL